MFLAVLIVVVATAGASPALQPRRPGQDSFLTRAAYVDGRLWMRSDAGVLFSVGRGEVRVREEGLEGPVLDLCASGSGLHVVTRSRDRWRIWRLAAGGWSAEARIAPDAPFIGLACSSDSLAVVAMDRVTVVKPGRSPRTTRLTKKLPGGVVTTLFLTDAWLFVGSNRGEFGGGLLRARLSDGRVNPVLDESRDPVNGIASIPWKAGCVAVSVGLVHMGTHGRLVEVCGGEVRDLLTLPNLHESETSTVPFFGVAAAGGRILAVGLDGLYRVSESGVQREELPSFKDVGGFHAHIGAVGPRLVMTGVNRRRSLSGLVPMLAEEPGTP